MRLRRMVAVYVTACLGSYLVVTLPVALIASVVLPSEWASLLSFVVGALCGAAAPWIVLGKSERLYRWVTA